MQIFDIESFEHLIRILRQPAYGCGHVIYRGVKDQRNATLIPSIGRLHKVHSLSLKDLNLYEQTLLNQFRHRAFSELTKIPHNDWIWLALAQHHGLPTRLLDWTFSPLVAAYFATEPAVDQEGNIEPVSQQGSMMYVLHDLKIIDAYTTKQDPFEVHEHSIVFAPVITNRIAGQGGLFTIQPDPRKDFTDGFEQDKKKSRWIQQLRFAPAVSSEIQSTLYQLGIRKSGIFPDLTGFADDARIKSVFADTLFNCQQDA